MLVSNSDASCVPPKFFSNFWITNTFTGLCSPFPNSYATNIVSGDNSSLRTTSFLKYILQTPTRTVVKKQKDQPVRGQYLSRNCSMSRMKCWVTWYLRFKYILMRMAFVDSSIIRLFGFFRKVTKSIITRKIGILYPNSPDSSPFLLIGFPLYSIGEIPLYFYPKIE